MTRFLFTGDTDFHEFKRVRQAFRDGQLASQATILGPESALDWLRTGARSVVEHVLLAQALPGRFSDATISAIHRHAPLAQIWVLAGSWCEGDTRIGLNRQGVNWQYWYQWPALEQALLRSDRPSHRLPRTATASDRIEFDLQALRALPPQPCSIRVQVDADSRTTQRGLDDGLAMLGYNTRTDIGTASKSEPDSEASVCLWVRNDLQRNSRHELRDFVVQSAPAPVVAILGFPRSAEISAALECGVSEVLGQPLLLCDLGQTIRSVATPAQSATLRVRAG